MTFSERKPVNDGTCQKQFEKVRAGDFTLNDASRSGRRVETEFEQIKTLRIINDIRRERKRTYSKQLNEAHQRAFFDSDLTLSVCICVYRHYYVHTLERKCAPTANIMVTALIVQTILSCREIDPYRVLITASLNLTKLKPVCIYSCLSLCLLEREKFQM